MARARNQLIVLDGADFGETPAIHREPSRGVAVAQPARGHNYPAITLGTLLVIVAVWFGVHSVGTAYEHGRADAKVEYLEDEVERLRAEVKEGSSFSLASFDLGMDGAGFPIILAIAGGVSIIIGLGAMANGGGLLGFGIVAVLGLGAMAVLS